MHRRTVAQSRDHFQEPYGVEKSPDIPVLEDRDISFFCGTADGHLHFLHTFTSFTGVWSDYPSAPSVSSNRLIVRQLYMKVLSGHPSAVLHETFSPSLSSTNGEVPALTELLHG